MRRLAQLSLILATLVAVCARPDTSALLPLPYESSAYGRTECDVLDRPFRRVNIALPPELQRWVRIHESEHVAQANRVGSCGAFMLRYAADPQFRLASEAGAFCAVVDAQRRAKAEIDPSLDAIVRILQGYPYRSVWSDAEVRAELRCATPKRRWWRPW